MKIKIQQKYNREDLEYDIISERVSLSFHHKLNQNIFVLPTAYLQTCDKS